MKTWFIFDLTTLFPSLFQYLFIHHFIDFETHFSHNKVLLEILYLRTEPSPPLPPTYDLPPLHPNNGLIEIIEIIEIKIEMRLGWLG